MEKTSIVHVGFVKVFDIGDNRSNGCIFILEHPINLLKSVIKASYSLWLTFSKFPKFQNVEISRGIVEHFSINLDENYEKMLSHMKPNGIFGLFHGLVFGQFLLKGL